MQWYIFNQAKLNYDLDEANKNIRAPFLNVSLFRDFNMDYMQMYIDVV